MTLLLYHKWINKKRSKILISKIIYLLLLTIFYQLLTITIYLVIILLTKQNITLNDFIKSYKINIIKRYLGMEIDPGIIGSDNRYEYRNKITYRCVNGKLGWVSIDNDLVYKAIKDCKK